MTEINQDQKEMFVGLNVGGTNCSVVVGDSSFLITHRTGFETHTERGYQAILDEFKEHIQAILDKYPDHKLKRIGISCGARSIQKRG